MPAPGSALSGRRFFLSFCCRLFRDRFGFSASQHDKARRSGFRRLDEEYIEMAEEKCPPRFALLGIELGLQAPPPHRATRHRLRAPPSRP